MIITFLLISLHGVRLKKPSVDRVRRGLIWNAKVLFYYKLVYFFRKVIIIKSVIHIQFLFWRYQWKTLMKLSNDHLKASLHPASQQKWSFELAVSFLFNEHLSYFSPSTFPQDFLLWISCSTLIKHFPELLVQTRGDCLGRMPFVLSFITKVWLLFGLPVEADRTNFSSSFKDGLWGLTISESKIIRATQKTLRRGYDVNLLYSLTGQFLLQGLSLVNRYSDNFHTSYYHKACFTTY